MNSVHGIDTQSEYFKEKHFKAHLYKEMKRRYYKRSSSQSTTIVAQQNNLFGNDTELVVVCSSPVKLDLIDEEIGKAIPGSVAK